MPSNEVGAVYKLDVGQPLAALEAMSRAEDNMRAEILKGQQAIRASFASVIAQREVALSNAIAGYQEEARAAQAASQSAQQAARELNAQLREQERARKAATNTAEQERLTKEIAKTTLEIQKAKQAIDESRQADQKARDAARQVGEQRRIQANETKLVAAANKDAAAAAKQEELAARQAAGAAKEAAAAAKSAATSSGSGDSGGGFFDGLLNKAAKAGAGLFAFNTIANRVKQGLEDYGAIKGVQAALTAVAGSATAGAQEFAYIKREADDLGLSLVPTAKAYTGLFTASKEANLSVATTREVFEGVAGAAKVLNLTADDTNGVLLALQQIASKGTVASEELRGQIGERLPGAFGLAAKAMGLTTAELGKQLQAGKILASDFLPKFAAQLKATYGDATADAATQVGSNIGRINTFIANSSAKAGALVAPYVAALAALVTPLKTTSQVAQESAEAYFKQAEASRTLTATVTPLLARYEELSGQTTRNTSEQKELDSVIQQLAKTVPGAVTEFDKYGKALGINGAAIRKFLDDERNLTRYRNLEPLKKNRADLVRLINEQDELQKQLNQTVTDPETGLKRRQVVDASSGGTGGGGSFVRTLSQEESDKITADYTEKLAAVQRDIDANLELRQRLRGYNPLLPKEPTATEIQGLVEKQQQIIKDLQARQLKATRENKGNGADFLLGAGGLDEQLDQAQKELDRLLNKTTKARKASDDALQARLRALYKERETLRELAAKAAVKESDDEIERARLAYEEELAGIEKVRKALIQRELDVAKAARKRGGEALVKKQGGNADGVIDGVQAEQIDIYKAAAEKRLTKELERIEREREALLLSLREDSDQTELDRLEAAFNEQVRLHENNAGVLLALEAKYERDRNALLKSQATKRAQQELDKGTNQANATAEVYGAGTGKSYFDAQLDARQEQLDAEKSFAEKRLDILKDSKGKEAEVERGALAAQLLRIRNQQKALDIESKLANFSIYKLILGENDDEKTRAALDKVAQTVINSLSEINAAEQQAAAERVSASNQVINELTGQLAAQIQLNEQGSASNIKGLQDQIAAEKAARRQAIEDQRKAAKEKVLIDTLTQASSIATAAAEVFATFAPIPFVGVPLGIAAAALLVGAFTASKVQAYQAAGSTGGSFFKGGFTGEGNPREVSTAQGDRGYEYHKREFVMDHKLTDQYRHSLFEPLHKGRLEDIDWGSAKMRDLLLAMPEKFQLPANPWTSGHFDALLPDLTLPDRLREEKRLHVEHTMKVSMEPLLGGLSSKLDAMHDRLAAIESSNSRMADRPDLLRLSDDRYLERTENGSTNLVKIVGSS